MALRVHPAYYIQRLINHISSDSCVIPSYFLFFCALVAPITAQSIERSAFAGKKVSFQFRFRWWLECLVAIAEFLINRSETFCVSSWPAVLENCSASNTSSCSSWVALRPMLNVKCQISAAHRSHHRLLRRVFRISFLHAACQKFLALTRLFFEYVDKCFTSANSLFLTRTLSFSCFSRACACVWVRERVRAWACDTSWVHEMKSRKCILPTRPPLLRTARWQDGTRPKGQWPQKKSFYFEPLNSHLLVFVLLQSQIKS